METKDNKLNQLKGNNPFSVPDGYLENLTAQIMDQLPEKEIVHEAKKISLMDRVRPWLYMAAVFAGLGLFFKAIINTEKDEAVHQEALLVKSELTPDAVYAAQLSEAEEFYEYLEDQYAGYYLSEQINDSE